MFFFPQVAKHKDPRDACAAIVAESYRLWLQYETRTDDITIIVVHINGLKDVRKLLFVDCISSFLSLLDPEVRFWIFLRMLLGNCRVQGLYCSLLFHKLWN